MASLVRMSAVEIKKVGTDELEKIESLTVNGENGTDCKDGPDDGGDQGTQTKKKKRNRKKNKCKLCNIVKLPIILNFVVTKLIVFQEFRSYVFHDYC